MKNAYFLKSFWFKEKGHNIGPHPHADFYLSAVFSSLYHNASEEADPSLLGSSEKMYNCTRASSWSERRHRKNARIVGKRVIVNYQTLWEKYWRIVRKEQCSVRTLDSTVKGWRRDRPSVILYSITIVIYSSSSIDSLMVFELLSWKLLMAKINSSIDNHKLN